MILIVKPLCWWLPCAYKVVDSMVGHRISDLSCDTEGSIMKVHRTKVLRFSLELETFLRICHAQSYDSWKFLLILGSEIPFMLFPTSQFPQHGCLYFENYPHIFTVIQGLCGNHLESKLIFWYFWCIEWPTVVLILVGTLRFTVHVISSILKLPQLVYLLLASCYD